MKLKTPVHYQNILRAIGQGLENLNVNSFDLLEASENEFVVGGDCNKTKALSARKPSPKKSFLGLFLNNDTRKTTKTSGSLSFHFSGLRFTPSDIELLDQKGKVLRSTEDSSPPNPQSLSHILRMTGTYLDHHGSRLLRLSWDRQIITLWHTNRMDIEAKDIFTPLNLYDQWVHQFKKRKQIRTLKPTGSD
jgi:hypothetical protein